MDSAINAFTWWRRSAGWARARSMSLSSDHRQGPTRWPVPAFTQSPLWQVSCFRGKACERSRLPWGDCRRRLPGSRRELLHRGRSRLAGCLPHAGQWPVPRCTSAYLGGDLPGPGGTGKGHLRSGGAPHRPGLVPACQWRASWRILWFRGARPQGPHGTPGEPPRAGGAPHRPGRGPGGRRRGCSSCRSCWGGHPRGPGAPGCAHPQAVPARLACSPDRAASGRGHLR